MVDEAIREAERQQDREKARADRYVAALREIREFIALNLPMTGMDERIDRIAADALDRQLVNATAEIVRLKRQEKP
jgi:hypothetical protein